MNQNIKEVLNYGVFLTLFIGSFYFIYRTYTEIIGLCVLFVINTAFLLFVFMRLSGKIFIAKSTEYIPSIAFFSILVGLLFTFISLLFTISMIYNTQQKYSAQYGTNLELPEPYHTEVDIYKRILISCYCLVAILLFVTMQPASTLVNPDTFDKFITSISMFKIYDTIKKPITKMDEPINFGNIQKYIIDNGFKFFTIITSVALLGLSSSVIYISNQFLKLNRLRITA